LICDFLCVLYDYFAAFAFKRDLLNRKGRKEGAKNAKKIKLNVEGLNRKSKI